MPASQQKLFVVFGGELSDPQSSTFSEPGKLDVRGIFESYDEALKAWRAASFSAVDNAFIRYRIAPLS
ncbi:MAG: DUF4170 domain-containing protein [Alphaproteobacteria bacterium]|nr:DUF4170 domain-containing protein [Alphaproteobacteria bacterium]